MQYKEFIGQVQNRARLATEVPEAVFHARAVVEVLKDAVSPGEIAHLKSQLPPDLYQAF